MPELDLESSFRVPLLERLEQAVVVRHGSGSDLRVKKLSLRDKDPAALLQGLKDVLQTHRRSGAMKDRMEAGVELDPRAEDS